MPDANANMLRLHVPLASRRPSLDPAQALAARIRMVLETTPGDLPYRPRFGCNLTNFAGQPATDRVLEQVRVTVEDALTRFVPGITVRACEVRARTHLGSAPGGSRDVPVAEQAMVRLGVQATLEIRVDVKSKFGSLNVSTALTP